MRYVSTLKHWIKRFYELFIENLVKWSLDLVKMEKRGLIHLGKSLRNGETWAWLGILFWTILAMLLLAGI